MIKKYLLSFLIFFLLLGCASKEKIVPQSVGYMPLGNSFFLSVKNLREHVEDVLVVKNQDLPVITTVNRYILTLEHLVEHVFTPQDLNELLGQDFSMALAPQFLLVSRSKNEYNVFYYLKTKSDLVVKKEPYEIRMKEISALNKKIYYAFAHEYFFASESLSLLKRTIRKSGRAKSVGFNRASRVIIHDGLKQGPLKLFFRGRKVILWGESLNELKFNGNLKENSSYFELNNIVACNLRLLPSERFTKEVFGKLMIRDFIFDKNVFLANYRVLSPLDLKYKRQKKVEEMVMKNLHSASLPLTKRRSGASMLYANISESPMMRDDSILFKVDLVAAATFPFFSPEFAAILRKIGSINVRKDI